MAVGAKPKITYCFRCYNEASRENGPNLRLILATYLSTVYFNGFTELAYNFLINFAHFFAILESRLSTNFDGLNSVYRLIFVLMWRTLVSFTTYFYKLGYFNFGILLSNCEGNGLNFAV